jgi:hypothetical protein
MEKLVRIERQRYDIVGAYVQFPPIDYLPVLFVNERHDDQDIFDEFERRDIVFVLTEIEEFIENGNGEIARGILGAGEVPVIEPDIIGKGGVGDKLLDRRKGGLVVGQKTDAKIRSVSIDGRIHGGGASPGKRTNKYTAGLFGNARPARSHEGG